MEGCNDRGELKAELQSREPVVRFRNVQKSYDGETLVVKGLDLDIHEGEFLTMLGPSGSGKTSCLMMLAGFEAISGGEVFLAGKKLNDLSPQSRGIGMVFQNYALFPHMTVEENLAFPLKVRKLSGAEVKQRVSEVLAMVKLTGFEKRRPMQLSGGQQQRVAVARALIYKPKIVLMDEPLGALDKKLREEMQLEIKRLHHQLGLTVVYVTHDQSEALTMSDRIAVFHDGELQQVAAPEDLYERPANFFVAQFIGENNALAGVVEKVEGAHCRVRLDRGRGDAVTAIPVGVRAGDAVTVAIRPENVIMAEAAEPYSNSVTGRVEELIYLGDHLRVRFSVPGQSDFFAKVSKHQTELRVRQGETIRLGWNAESARAFPVTLQEHSS
ncbi:MAG: ABC transporter ATP-binding protein [Parvibaculaceae bacterium]